MWWFGAPLSGDDDLFFIGPALQLHNGEPLSNPLIRFWHPEATQTFFYQPPFFQYALAGWLVVFGVSAGSVAAFQCAAGAVASVAAGVLLQRLQLRGAWFVGLVFGAAMLSKAMRHDMLGLALLFGGLALLTYRSRASLIAGSALLAAAPFTWPVLACYAVPFGIAVLAHPGRRPRPPRLELFACLALGTLLSSVLFLLAIDFALLDFLRHFVWHAQSRRNVPLVPELVIQLTDGRTELLQGPAYVITAGLIITVLLNARRYPTLAGLAVALLVAVGLTTVAYTSALQGAAWQFVALAMGLLALNIGPARSVLPAAVVVVAAVLWANTLHLVAWGWVRPERPDYYRSLAARAPTDKCLGLDAVAARYVFDYRLPACAFAWQYSYPPPKFYPREHDRPVAGTAWMTSYAPLGHTAGIPPEERLTLLGVRFGSIPPNRMRITITP